MSILFIQESGVCAHLQARVHISLDLRHLHLNVWQPVVHEHDTTSKQLSGTAGRDISVGTSCPSVSFQPCVVGSGKFGCVQCACHHTEAWWWTLCTWNRRASLVGGSACMERDPVNNMTQALSMSSSSAMP